MNKDKLTIEKVVVDGKEQLRLKGVIDEDTDFGMLKKETGPLYLNLSEVTGINSLGIRSWVNFWKDQMGKKVFYVECPPVIVRQMSMIPSFTGGAEVVSVFAPYVCDQCEGEELVLVKAEEFGSNPPQIKDSFSCSKCQKGEMELDASPQQYFAFKKK